MIREARAMWLLLLPLFVAAGCAWQATTETGLLRDVQVGCAVIWVAATIAALRVARPPVVVAEPSPPMGR